MLAVCFNDVWYALVCDTPYYDTKISHTNYVGFQHTNNEGYSVILKHSSDEKSLWQLARTWKTVLHRMQVLSSLLLTSFILFSMCRLCTYLHKFKLSEHSNRYR